MDFNYILYFLLKGFEISSPIAFASLGAVFSEKSGTVNIGIEGFIGLTSFMIVWGSITFKNIWIGLLLAIISGIIFSLIHALLTINFKIDHIISGVTLIILSNGLTRFLSQKLFGMETQTPMNPYLFPQFFNINSMSLSLIPIVILSWFILYKTVFGLRLRSVGENPQAADTLGINVFYYRYIGVILSGVFCGLSSAVLYPSQWISGMTAGRGFIALAAMIFGRWHPIGAVLASLLFGYAETFRILFETKLHIPSQFVQMFPYILALIILTFFIGKSKPPSAVGTSFER